MINVDISNVWTCVSLPELLGTERQIFDAHNLLRASDPEGPDFLGWLNMPFAARERLTHGVSRASEQICGQAEVLVVCGTGGAFQGARAAVELYCGSQRNLLGGKPEILFVGESLSPRQWIDLSQLLEDREFSLCFLSTDGRELGCNVIGRGLRWLLERKYGPKAKTRVSVATVVGSPLHKMAQEEGYDLFPLPKEQGGLTSTLTAAALLPMAVAGIDPQAVMEGAAEARKELDIRSFENPAWLYAAARFVLPQKGRGRELLCLFDHNFASFGSWWQRQTWRQGIQGLTVEPVLLPGDLEAMDDLVCAGAGVFETMVHVSPMVKKIPVEMDWKDYDGLGCLSGKTLDYVEQQMMTAMAETHNMAGVPVVDIDAGDLTAEHVGQLFCFFELSGALTAQLFGTDPFAQASSAVRRAAMEAMDLA